MTRFNICLVPGCRLKIAPGPAICPGHKAMLSPKVGKHLKPGRWSKKLAKRIAAEIGKAEALDSMAKAEARRALENERIRGLRDNLWRLSTGYGTW